MSELDVESIEDDAEAPQNPESHAASSPFEIDKDVTREITKSTKQPLKPRPGTSRKKQAEEEYQLIKNLSESIAERHKRQKLDKSVAKNSLEAFGKYVTQALSEMNSEMCHLAQHKINTILFQAQTGFLLQDSQSAATMQQQQLHPFQAIPSYHISPSSNHTASQYNPIGVERQNSSLREDTIPYNPPNIWSDSN